MIRLARRNDMDTIMDIYQAARNYMQDTGNPTQWGESYPAKELLEEDIEKKQLYVCVERNCDQEGNGSEEIVHGVFAFIIGPDPTYAYIENGKWLNDDTYGTIHRIAGDGKVKGIFADCLEYCRSQIDNLRIDTHENNLTMQHLIEKNGFKKCGIIYIEDGSPRIAYQYTGI